MPILDIVLASLIGYGIIKGLIKGLFVEVASLLALLLGAYGAVHFSNYAADFITSFSNWSEKTISVVSFVITFSAIVMAISLAGKAMTKLAGFVALGFFNKILGAFFGGLKITLIISVLILVMDKTNLSSLLLSEQRIEKSFLYKRVRFFAPAILPKLSSGSSIIDLPSLDKQIELN